MAPRDDDVTLDDGTFATNADASAEGGDDRFSRAGNHAHGALSYLFRSCDGDPKGSVHRAWGITLLFIAIFFAMAFIEGEFVSGGSAVEVWRCGGAAVTHLVLSFEKGILVRTYRL